MERLLRKIIKLSLCVWMGCSILSIPINRAVAGTYNCGPPPFKTIDVLPNVLIILDNSNSMDEDFTGAAVGSANPSSRSEIARHAILQLIHTYGNRLRIGLMAYKQSGIESRYLHNSYYYCAYDSTRYDPDFDFQGASTEDTYYKRYEAILTDSEGHKVHVYYNQALPYYSGTNDGTRFAKRTSGDCYDIYAAKTDQTDTGGYADYRWHGCFEPTDDDIALGYYHFGDRMAWKYVSKAWFSNTSPGPGYLHVSCEDYTPSHEETLEAKLATCQFDSNTDTPIQNAGLTPIEGTLDSALSYFQGKLSASEADSGVDRSSPVQYPECQKNFVILVTDGLPSVDKYGHAKDAADLIPGCVSAIQDLKSAGISTYILGLALGEGGSLLDQLAVAAGTDVNGHAYMADHPADLFAQLDAIFQNIISGASSGTAVAVVNSTSDSGKDRIFSAKFVPLDESPSHNPSAWIGMLEAINSSSGAPAWEAGSILNDTSPANRHIYTSTTPNSTAQEPFDTSNLALTYSTLGVPSEDRDDLINYIRGEDVPKYRPRTYTDEKGNTYSSWKLGDIIYSTPAIRPAVPDEGWDAVTFYTTSGAQVLTGYKDFRPQRRDLVIVGANDGMVHAFNVYPPDAGHEAWAYIPFNLLKKLKYLADPTDPYCHEWYVDLSPVVADVQEGSQWKTILMCGEREGGKAYFALDITKDGSGYPHPMWEFKDSDLGESWSIPQIGRVTMSSSPHYRWIGIFGSGYNNSDSKGYLYGIDVNNGNQIFKLKVDDATGNVMGSPAAIDFDDNTCIDHIYVGDMLGRMWKVITPDHIPDSSDSSWGDAASPTKAILITTGDNQPIRVKPVITLFHRPGGDCPAVYFGTGRFDSIADKTTTDVQSFYCVLDDEEIGGTLPVSKSDLVNADNPGIDGYCSEHGTLPEDKRGWYINLDKPVNTLDTESHVGERVTSTGLLVGGIIFFTTFTPDNDPCKSGGIARLYALKYDTGCPPNQPVLDVNGDNIVDTSDNSADRPGGKVPKGIVLGYGYPSAPVYDQRHKKIYVSSFPPDSIPPPPSGIKIHYWREIFK